MRIQQNHNEILGTWLWIVMCQCVMIAQTQPVAIQVVLRDEVPMLIQQAEELAFKDPDQAYLLLDDCWAIASKASDNQMKFTILRTRGYIAEQNSDFTKAFNCYTQASELAVSTSDILTIKQDMAIVEKKRANYIQASQLFIETLQLAEATNDWEMVQAAYDGLGALHDAVSDYEVALKFQLKSLEVAKRNKDDFGAMISYQNIAVTHGKSKNFDLAITNIEEALRLALQTNDTLHLGNAHFDKANILLAMGQNATAYSEHQRGLTLYRQVGYKTKIAKSLIAIADIAMQFKQIEKAELYLLEAKSLEVHLQNSDRAALFLAIGDFYKRTLQFEAADSLIQSSIAISRQFKYLNIEERGLRALASLKKETQHYSEAFLFLEQAAALNDSIFSREQTRLRAEQQFKYNVSQLDQEIIELKAGKERSKFLGGVVALLLLVTSLLTVVFLQRRGNNKLRIQKNALRNQNNKLGESNAILKQFAYAAAHDLKEPLRTIGSFTSLIDRKHGMEMSAGAKEYMGFVTQGVLRMNNLLTDLLQYSTFIVQDAVNERTDTTEVVQETLRNLHSTIVQSGAEIKVLSPLPNLQMSKFHVAQLLQNLVSNALKFNDDKPVIKISGHQLDNKAVLKIEDNGIGMDPEHCKIIFQLFHQLNKHNGKFEGTGVGLAICRNIVDKYQGQIEVESRLGQGTCFILHLPVACT